MYARVTVNDVDREESDEYELDSVLPLEQDHVCVQSGMEQTVARFHTQVKSSLHENPCEAIPALYNRIRYVIV